MNFDKQNLKQLIKQKALEIGFNNCGIANAEIDQKFKNWYENYLDLGYNAELHYLNTNKSKILNPQNIIPDAKSVICFTAAYQFDDNKINKHISRYAQVNDYHTIMKSKIKEMVGFIKNYVPNINARIFVDSGYFPEKYFAAKAGLGFIGKNRLLINPEIGSFQFIGAILTNIDLPPDNKISESCGSCSICIDSCPTNALNKNGVNANLCLSYHSIENKSQVSNDIAKHLKSRWFGCDICQEVCPWNKFENLPKPRLFDLQKPVTNLNSNNLCAYNEENFKIDFRETVIFRTGLKKLKHNAGC
ncbi:MAG: tRNA epoxyqueuosine(34) reductase QueG [Bacteroidales bacterium]|nr:tRNA epoxyqueuosine(34) reductase QueG [Bacteroidales bacterium]